MNRFLIPILTAALALFALAPSTSTAQISDEYQVAVSLSVINLPVFQPGVPNLGAALKTITAKANDQICTTETIAGAAADVVLHIGGAGQPATCSLDGAKVTLIDGNGHSLFTSFTLTKGTRDTLSNLAPVPPSSGGPSNEEVLVTSNEFQVLIPAAVLSEGGTGGPGATYRTVTARANGTPCITANVAGVTADVILRLGTTGQPEVCSLEGATVTFAISQGTLLLRREVLRKGSRVQILRLGIEPPHNPDPLLDEPSVSPSPTPRLTAISPPDTGDAGMR